MNQNLEIIQDYQVVRNIGLALAALAFLIAVATASSSDLPGTQIRARSLILQSALVFLILAGDRILARGVAQMFGIPYSSLPLFWQ